MVSLTRLHRGSIHKVDRGALLPIDKKGLVGYWPMEENTGGTLYDESKNGNDGTIHGAVWAKGKNGFCLKFDGVDDYVETTGYTITAPFSVIAWFNTNTLATDVTQNITGDSTEHGPILRVDGRSKYNGARILFYNDAGEWKEIQVTSIDNLSTGTWFMLVGTYEGSTLYGNLNGGAFTNSMSATGFVSGANFRIGCRREWEYFDGYIDEVRVYNRVLSEAEIAAIYHKEK